MQDNFTDSKLRIVILNSTGDSKVKYSADILYSLFKDPELNIVAVIVKKKASSKKSSGLLKTIKKSGSMFFVDASYSVLSKLRGKKTSWDYVPEIVKLDYKKYFIGPVEYVNKINSSETAELIKKYKADICFHSGGVILKEPVLSAAPFGVLGYHHGDITKYRGGCPAFWELYNKEKEAGVTLQILSDKLDTGDIVLLERYRIDKKETIASLRKKLNEDSVDLAAKALKKLQNKDFKPESNYKKGEYRKDPGLINFTALKLKRLFA